MKYFKNVRSLKDLKAQYRKLALENHPDAGGDIEKMKAVNAEYDVLYAVWSRKANSENPDDPVTESGAESRSEFYTQNGWKGSNFSWDLTTKEIAERVRAYAKAAYPSWKFSVRIETFAGGSSISVRLTEAPAEILDRAAIDRLAEHEESVWGDGYGRTEARRWRRMAEEGLCSDLNVYGLERTAKPYLTARAWQVISDVDRFVKSYRFDDSDGMIDYFHTNFYYSLGIGRWDKPLKVTGKADKPGIGAMERAA